MEQRTFVVKGTFIERKETKKFGKEVTAHNEGFAREKVLSDLGSRHKLRRSAVKIDSVQAKSG